MLYSRFDILYFMYMKKIFFFLTIWIFALSAIAQEDNNELNLSFKQIEQIKQINKEAYPKFEEIGRNIRLSGYEKAQQRRILILEQKKQIMVLLSPEQREIWENKFKMNSLDVDMRDVIKKDYDSRIKDMDELYNLNKRTIESNVSLDKNDKKKQIKSLQESYKTEKERLKGEREAVRNAFY